MKKLNKTIQAKSAKVKIAEAKVRIAQRKLAEAKKALKEAETKTINGYPIEELGKGRFIDLHESVITLDDDGAYAVQLPAESKYAGKYFVWGYIPRGNNYMDWDVKAYITDSIENIDIRDIIWGRVDSLLEYEDCGEEADPLSFEIDEDTNENFVTDEQRDDTIGLYFGEDACRFIWNVNSVSFGIRPKLDDDDED